jgi:hypothetical protein
VRVVVAVSEVRKFAEQSNDLMKHCPRSRLFGFAFAEAAEPILHDWSFAGGERSKILWSPKIWTLQFLEENSGSTFYHATTYYQARIIYSRIKRRASGFLQEGATDRCR